MALSQVAINRKPHGFKTNSIYPAITLLSLLYSIFWSDCLAQMIFMGGYLRTRSGEMGLDTDYLRA